MPGKPEPQRLFPKCPREEQDDGGCDRSSGRKLTFQDPPKPQEAASVSFHDCRLKQHEGRQLQIYVLYFNARTRTNFTHSPQCGWCCGMGTLSQKSCRSSIANSCQQVTALFYHQKGQGEHHYHSQLWTGYQLPVSLFPVQLTQHYSDTVKRFDLSLHGSQQSDKAQCELVRWLSTELQPYAVSKTGLLWK